MARRRGGFYSRGFALLGLALILTATGCGDDDAPVPPQAAPTAARPQTAASNVSGTVTNLAGQPLAGATVNIYGSSFDAGEGVAAEATTDAQGYYAGQVPVGTYSIDAFYPVDYNGRSYQFELEALGVEDGVTYSTESPVVANFIWKINGLRPGAENAPDEGTSYYGGSLSFDIVDVHYESVVQGGMFESLFPQGVTAEVTLTPDGPLIDGSPGQPVTFTHDIFNKNEAQWSEHDVPVGRYTVTARAFTANGTPRDLQIVGVAPGTDPPRGQGAPSATLDFEPLAGVGGIERMGISFIYGEPYPPL